MNVVRAGCRENTSGLRLRENYFSLDIPLYRTSGWPTIRQPLQPPNASGTAAAQRNPKPSMPREHFRLAAQGELFFA